VDRAARLVAGKEQDVSELDRIAELAVQNERERIYALLLMHPWRGPDADEETAIDRAIKADRFDLMALVRMGVEAGSKEALQVAALTWGKASDAGADVIGFPSTGNEGA